MAFLPPIVGDADWTVVERVGLELFEAGHDSPEIVELASVSRDSTHLLALVSRALDATGEPKPSEADACEVAALETASDILLGRLDLNRGGQRLWRIADAAPGMKEKLKPFIGMTSEWEEDAGHRREYEVDIAECAKQYVSEHLAN